MPPFDPSHASLVIFDKYSIKRTIFYSKILLTKPFSVFDWYERPLEKFFSFSQTDSAAELEINYNIHRHLFVIVPDDKYTSLLLDFVWCHRAKLPKALNQMRGSIFSLRCVDKDLHKCLIYFNIRANCLREMSKEKRNFLSLQRKLMFRKRFRDGIRIFNKGIFKTKRSEIRKLSI